MGTTKRHGEVSRSSFHHSFSTFRRALLVHSESDIHFLSVELKKIHRINNLTLRITTSSTHGATPTSITNSIV